MLAVDRHRRAAPAGLGRAARAIAVSLTFSLCIHGAARAPTRAGPAATAAATVYGALAVPRPAFAATVVFGVLVITDKGWPRPLSASGGGGSAAGAGGRRWGRAS